MQRIPKALNLLFLFNIVILLFISCNESETIKENINNEKDDVKNYAEDAADSQGRTDGQKGSDQTDE